MAIHIYGQFNDYTSIATVSRAICKELHRNKIKITVRGTGAISPTYVDCPWPLSLNSHADVAIYIGYPEVAPNWLKGHKTKILITVCETNAIPSEWVGACNQMDHIIVPSQFCRQVYMDSGVRKPVIVVPHGVSEGRTTISKTSSLIELVHISGAASFPHRKGTPALLKAWKAVTDNSANHKLTLKIARESRMMEFIARLGVTNVEIDDNLSLSPNRMAAYLSLFDAVIQPSRGEGFGIVPLEARTLGIPTIITAISGHSEHFAPGVDVEVPVGPYKPMVTQGNGNGFAPSVEQEHVELALREYLADVTGWKGKAVSWAERFGSLWYWRHTLKPLVKLVAPMAARSSRTIRMSDSIGKE